LDDIFTFLADNKEIIRVKTLVGST
jgi:hypothetical protein